MRNGIWEELILFPPPIPLFIWWSDDSMKTMLTPVTVIPIITNMEKTKKSNTADEEHGKWGNKFLHTTCLRIEEISTWAIGVAWFFIETILAKKNFIEARFNWADLLMHCSLKISYWGLREVWWLQKWVSEACRLLFLPKEGWTHTIMSLCGCAWIIYIQLAN